MKLSSTLGKLTKHLTSISLSNGMGWSPDNRTMYYIDSLQKKLYAYDYDESVGIVNNQRVFVDYSEAGALIWVVCIKCVIQLQVAVSQFW